MELTSSAVRASRSRHEVVGCQAVFAIEERTAIVTAASTPYPENRNRSSRQQPFCLAAVLQRPLVDESRSVEFGNETQSRLFTRPDRKSPGTMDNI